MTEYSKPITIRWADLDPNFHVRHSVYYDFGAQIRVDFLADNGVTPKLMIEKHFGPVLFREEAVFRKEIRSGDKLTINVKLQKLREDHSRFTMIHEIKREDGTLCAKITVDGAWMDTHLRKLTAPPEEVVQMTDAMPKAEDFEWM
ncbi:acyl-CoA thioesterase [Solitalea canadensis]|uniref:Putative thioesterase n=1 Tax=Solitalea canadensis (strain ATCC 29591 / DSM 3403 / JCM 21819 / LMG 8368 / NBRC 15130 / NCIMB 12057 / USAM 9D) TaxID=929556 RepID=H8KVI7_SOLCM|nr:acyl-CoA thioesterase [Solitalea canadensis]AFD06490.1 putative thioesterase [Solitalea canadensis DSM 3403]